MVNFATPETHSHEINPVAPFETSQSERLSSALSRAFQNEPSFAWVLPDEQSRREMLPSIFFGAIRFAEAHGQIDTTATADAGALWIRPGRELIFSQLIRTETAPLPFKLGRSRFRRCMKLVKSIEQVRQRLARGPHWYLMAIGADPCVQEHLMGSALLQAGLSRADSDHVPCYLETFHDRSLPIYEAHGFRIAGAGCIPGGPSFWAMMRNPAV
jgi:hypothetical protein